MFLPAILPDPRNEFDSFSPFFLVPTGLEYIQYFYSTNIVLTLEQYKTPVFCPKFGSLSIRSLLYLMQGIEANGGLAVKKRFDYRERQAPFDQVEYKTPGKTLVSAGQWDHIKNKLQSQCITDGEMPPVYIPRSPFNNYEYNYQEGAKI